MVSRAKTPQHLSASGLGLRTDGLVSEKTNESGQLLFRYQFQNGYTAGVLLSDPKEGKFDVWAGHLRASPVGIFRQKVTSQEANELLSKISQFPELSAEVRQIRYSSGMLLSELLRDP